MDQSSKQYYIKSSYLEHDWFFGKTGIKIACIRDGNSWEDFIPRGIEGLRNCNLAFLED